MLLDDNLSRAVAYTESGLHRFGYVTESEPGMAVVCHATVTARAYAPDNTYTGAVYDRHRRLIASTQRFNERDIVPADPELLEEAEWRQAEQHRVALGVYGGILFPILGHFLFESIARLWPFMAMALRASSGKAGRPRLIFHPWPGLDPTTIFDNPLYGAMLRALGFDARDILIADRPFAVETLVVPDAASRYHADLNVRMAGLADFLSAGIAASAQGRADPRLYLSRSRWAENARIRNERAIDAWAERRGLRVVHPETLAPPELLRLLAGAETVVASDGSHAHLAVFCRPRNARRAAGYKACADAVRDCAAARVPDHPPAAVRERLLSPRSGSGRCRRAGRAARCRDEAARRSAGQQRLGRARQIGESVRRSPRPRSPPRAVSSPRPRRSPSRPRRQRRGRRCDGHPP